MWLKPAGWNLIVSLAVYEDYKTAYAHSQGVDAPTQIQWGPPPESFPCLASTAFVAPYRVISAYVYLADAVELLDAIHAPLPAKPTGGSAAGGGSVQQEEFNRVVTAHQLAVVRLLIDTGIVKEEQYEKRFAAELARVDQWHADAKTKRRRKLTGGAGSVLPKLYPKENKES